jgi:hypothetical protein
MEQSANAMIPKQQEIRRVAKQLQAQGALHVPPSLVPVAEQTGAQNH